jgi:hypothetical protein
MMAHRRSKPASPGESLRYKGQQGQLRGLLGSDAKNPLEHVCPPENAFVQSTRSIKNATP